MLTVLAEIRELLAQPDNDYSWSSFLDNDAALEEIDAIVTEIQSTGHAPLMLRVLFAPTGPIQEVAISSGWGETFLVVADRFDVAWAAGQ